MSPASAKYGDYLSSIMVSVHRGGRVAALAAFVLTGGGAASAQSVDLEGLTLQRGELSTGAFGEGYVDRRHPHAYVHELMAGVESADRSVDASLFAGRGFVPFGSDDPMVRPMEKYPVNHHLAQIL